MIYDTNQSVIEQAARNHGYASSRRGGLIFPGTRVHVQRQGLLQEFQALPPERQFEIVNCVVDVGLLAVKKDPKSIAGALIACEPLIPPNTKGLVGAIRTAVQENEWLKYVVSVSLFGFDATECYTTIVEGGIDAVREPNAAKRALKLVAATKTVISSCTKAATAGQ